MNAPNNFSFSVALERMKNGDTVRRASWVGESAGMTIRNKRFVQGPPESDYYVELTEEEILAEDWEIVHGS